MPISDEEVQQILFGQGSPQQSSAGIPDEQVKQILSGAQQPTQEQTAQAGAIDLQSLAAPESPISPTDRAKLSILNPTDQESFLKSKFAFVQPTPDGKFAVGNDPRNLQPIDPEGMLNDFLGDVADLAGLIAPISGQIAGAAGGAMLGSAIPGAGTVSVGMAGGAIGAGAGEAINKAVAKAFGLSTEDAAEITKDILLTGAFGAAGEGVGVAAQKFGGTILAPKVAKAFDTMIKKTPGDPSKAVLVLAKTGKIAAGIPEQSTIDAAKYGFAKTFTPKNLDPKTVIPITRNLSAALEEATERLGKEVAEQTDTLLAVARRAKVDGKIQVDDIFSVVKQRAQSMEILDTFGKLNKNIAQNFPAESKAIQAMLRELGAVNKGRFVKVPGKTISVKKAVALNRAFGETVGRLEGTGKTAILDALRGSGQVAGLRPRITQLARKLGVDDYAEANANFSKFMDLKNDLQSIGLRPKNLPQLESFVKGLERTGQFTRQNLKDVQAMSNISFLRDWEMWNAAQDFTSASPNLLRLQAVAGLAGVTFGDSPEDKFTKAAIGIGLATPLGIRTVLKSGSIAARAGKVGTLRAIRRTRGSGAGKASRTSRAVLSQLIADGQKKSTPIERGQE